MPGTAVRAGEDDLFELAERAQQIELGGLDVDVGDEVGDGEVGVTERGQVGEEVRVEV